MGEPKTTFDYVGEIWSIADWVRDVIRPADYNKLILPFALLRRLECALEPTRDAVCKAYEQHGKDWGLENEAYCEYSGKSFYNISSFRLNDLGVNNTLDALMTYVDGFSPNARDILTRFKIRETCQDLQDEGMLHEVCMRFAGFDLSPETVSDRMMSDIYEHLIQRYGEEIAQGAEDFMTPRDVVRLAVSLVFANEDAFLNSNDGSVRSLYDGTCGTCGFISDALDLLDEWKERNPGKVSASIVPYGQEREGVTWAVGKTNLLLRNVSAKGQDRFDRMKDLSEHIMQGDTLSDDRFEGKTFHYQLTNPPYGKEWKVEEDAVRKEASYGFKGRFGAGLPAIGDGSMLFIQNVAAKLKPVEEGGGKAAIVLSGSPLFNGDAGSGPSNIRRWLFEKDYIDCIVKLPTEIFFRTGISTYIWILSNKKPEGRKGMIQLIDASSKRVPLKRNLGNKRYEISDEQIDWITRTYIDGHDHGDSVIVPAEEFMFRQIATRQPLHMRITVDAERTDELFAVSKPMGKTDEANRRIIRDWMTEHDGETHDYQWAATAVNELGKLMDKPKPPKSQLHKAITTVFGMRDPEAPIAVDDKGNTIYDPELNDKENIPYGMEFDQYMRTEVLPYAPETSIDPNVKDSGPLQDDGVGAVGTSISFNRYFYQYEQPRDPKEIANEILELEDGVESFMKGFLK
ncbi:class I SAM-dependent DNA methyltransferase [Bifidobacterium sp. SO1]|uniref:type I restriction-modification system subunit M n=1 Tax=Bifidobacterium sp. SO1 TaxID=2809029 RepID=UPI001BDCBF6F|nr:class I SAM-dependent DNA methyltransferase [Bifidobacterium sp. SO1]MBT1162891.1 SAM-dependent DNA methyltransferase [Bifidobacterium sp. SO1]